MSEILLPIGEMPEEDIRDKPRSNPRKPSKPDLKKDGMANKIKSSSKKKTQYYYYGKV